MRKAFSITLVTVATLAGAGTLKAHHSGSAYAPTPLWISGTVVGFEPSNPHTFTTLQARQADGTVRRWVVEGPPQARLDRVTSDFYIPTAGDVIGFCAFPYKSLEELGRLWPEVDYSGPFWSATVEGSSPQTVTGHVMIKPDGEIQYWEPHGIWAECIRSSDEPDQVWLDHLNTYRVSRETWCQQKTFALIQDDPSLSEFVEAFDDRLDVPCD